MNLDLFTVSKETTILEAMKKMDTNARGIVYVVDNDYVLIGSLTDGDIRRYILKHTNVNGLVQDIMFTQFRYLTKENIKQAPLLMRQIKINSVPIVDNEKHLISIEFNDGHRYYGEKNLKVPVVIMAGGKGNRLYPYTQVLPKPLIPIGDKTITEHIMDHFKVFGCDDFSMIVNYKKELIKAFFADSDANVHFYEEKEFLGTAGGLKMLEGNIRQTFFMTNCDILIEEDYNEIYQYHKKNKNIITLVCALKKEVIPYGTVKMKEDGTIQELTEKPSFEFLTNTGLYVIEPEFLKEIPSNTHIDITDVIQECIQKGLKTGVYPVMAENWMDMGQMEELQHMTDKLEGIA